MYVDPVVVSRALQRFAWEYWAALLLLPELVVFTCLIHELFLKSFLLSLTVGFLLMRHLRRFVQIMLSDAVRAKYTLIVLCMVSIPLKIRSFMTLTYDTLSF